MKHRCPYCANEVTVNKGGELRRHRCTTPATGPILIPLPWTRPPMMANDRRHWRSHAAVKAQTLAEARWAIRAAKVRSIVGAEVILWWRVPNMVRRDTDGPEPTKKVVLDALVKEGVLPDDSWVEVPRSWVEIEPPVKGMPAAMWLEIRVLTEYDKEAS